MRCEFLRVLRINVFVLRKKKRRVSKVKKLFDIVTMYHLIDISISISYLDAFLRYEAKCFIGLKTTVYLTKKEKKCKR